MKQMYGSDEDEGDNHRPTRRQRRAGERLPPLPPDVDYVPRPLGYSEQFIVEVFINTPDPSGKEAHEMAQRVVRSFDAHDASAQKPVVNVYGENAMVHFQFADFQTPDIEALVNGIDFEGPVFAEKRDFSRNFGTYSLHYTTDANYDSNMHVVATATREVLEYVPRRTKTRYGRVSRGTRDFVDYGDRFAYRRAPGMPLEKQRNIRRRQVEERQRRWRQRNRGEQDA